MAGIAQEGVPIKSLGKSAKTDDENNVYAKGVLPLVANATACGRAVELKTGTLTDSLWTTGVAEASGTVYFVTDNGLTTAIPIIDPQQASYLEFVVWSEDVDTYTITATAYDIGSGLGAAVATPEFSLADAKIGDRIKLHCWGSLGDHTGPTDEFNVAVVHAIGKWTLA